jgi:hypothetical protein
MHGHLGCAHVPLPNSALHGQESLNNTMCNSRSVQREIRGSLSIDPYRMEMILEGKEGK